MTWLDIVILLPLLIGLVRGLMKGLITELIAIAAVVLGFVGAKLWGDVFSEWIVEQFAWQQPICDAVAYALLFVGIALVLNIVGRLISKLLKAIHLGFVNRLLGGLFGATKWAIVVVVLVFCVHSLDQRFHFLKPETTAQSVIYPNAVEFSTFVLSKVPALDEDLPLSWR